MLADKRRQYLWKQFLGVRRKEYVSNQELRSNGYIRLIKLFLLRGDPTDSRMLVVLYTYLVLL